MALKANLLIDQGATLLTQFLMVDQDADPISLSGYTPTGQLRRHYTSSNSVAFTCEANTSAGIISIGLTANQTANLVAGRYVYDVELIDSDGVVTRIVEGIATVTPQVTR